MHLASAQYRLTAMLALIAMFFFVEIIVGYITNSMALVADSFHMFSDVVALLIAFISVRMSPKKWSKNTFGWARAEILGALVNAVFLCALCFLFIIESIKRFIDPQQIHDPVLLLIVGSLGLLINLIGLLLFKSSGTHHCHHHHHHHHAHQAHHHHRSLAQSEIIITDIIHRASDEDHHKGSNQDLLYNATQKANQLQPSALIDNDNVSLSPKKLINRLADGNLEPKLSGASDIVTGKHSNSNNNNSNQNKSHQSLIMTDGSMNNLSAIIDTSQCDQFKSNHHNHVNSNDNKNNQSHEHKHQHSSTQMNMRGVFLHAMADAISSVIVMISAVIQIFYTEWTFRLYVDPALSVIMVCLILKHTLPLLTESAMILLQAVPKHIQVDSLQRRLLEEVPGIVSVHEMHVWQLTGDRIIATAHIRCHKLQDYMRVARKVKEFFHNEGIHSTTIQPEFLDSDNQVFPPQYDNCLLDCPPLQRTICAPRTCCWVKYLV